MAFLTDRSLATGVTLQDLIHIVITGDTSQGNLAGSSYKATIQQVSDAIASGITATTLYEVGIGVESTQRISVGADASGDYSLVGGGTGNTASGDYSFVGGGYYNTTTGNYSSILGGSGNTVTHNCSSAVGLGVYSVSACTFHANYLALQNVPEIDSTNDNMLVRDVSTGVIKQRDISQSANYSTSAITSSQTLTWDKVYWGVSGSSNVDLTLPTTTSRDGYYLVIKDEAGTSGFFRIRLTPASGLIDGNSYVDMNINYMSLTIMVRNGNWYLI